MSNFASMKGKRLIIPFIIVILGVIYTYRVNKEHFDRKKLPVVQPRDVSLGNPDMVPEDLANKGIGHRIGRFEFLNQNGENVSLEDVKGKIFVVEYFFTTCLTICPIMNDEMKRVQEKFKGDDNFKILSFTVDPEIDDVQQMKKYASEHNAVDGQWHFLTGDKDKLYELARNSFFVLKPAEARNLGDAGSDFIHTNNFVLVDKELQIRGYYDGTSTEEVDTLMEDIEYLLNEEEYDPKKLY